MSQNSLDLSVSNLLPLLKATIQTPRDVARSLVAVGMGQEALWTALYLVTTVGIVLGQLQAFFLLQAVPAEGPYMLLLSNPIVRAGFWWLTVFVMVQAIFRMGNVMGGTGTLEGSLAVTTWLAVVVVTFQVLQTLALFILPWIAQLITLVSILLVIWVYTNFVAELHGFDNLVMVLIGSIVAGLSLMFALSLVLSLVMTSLGMTPEDLVGV
ncbi:MAG: YIP1 family protein [Pseudomonadota bacterium]